MDFSHRRKPYVARQFWFVMKFTVFFLIVALTQVSAKTRGQQVSISETAVSMKKVFKEIEKQSGYLFFYDADLLEKAAPVTVHVRNVSVEQALNAIFKGQPLTWSLENKTITIVQKENEVADKTVSNSSFNLTVKGRVTDESGRPLASVSVVIPGTPLGSMTNSDGEYLIENAPENGKLLFSYIGYISQTVAIKGRTEINIVLKLEMKSLDETIVIGYGTTTKAKNTGAISSVTQKEISQQPVDNPLTALQARVPGVVITQDNGLPGGGVRVQIRGLNSADAGTLPLYIVDGVPFTLFNGGVPFSDALNAYGTSGANGDISPFSMIAPEDILRIDVLKDADATAIYGSRGANGVILITTKQGSRGKTMFNVNVNNGIGNVNHYIPMMNTPQFLKMRREAFANSGVTPTVSNAPDLLVWDTTAYTNWQKWAIGGTAHFTNATASVSGGNALTTFLFTSTFRKEGTVFPGDYQTYTTSNRLNASHTSEDQKFKIETAVNYSYMNSNLPAQDLSTFYNLAPNFPIYKADSTLNFALDNPKAYLIRSYQAQTMNFISNINLSYKILPSLTLKANLGYSLTSLKQTNTNPASAQNISPTASASVRANANRLTLADNDNSNYIIEPQLEYVKKINEGALQVLVGTTFQQNKSSGVYLSGRGFSSEELITSISSAATVSASYSNYSLYKYNALFSRVNYDWKGKYIIDGTFRRDGSSRFGPGERFGNFGALGAAWIFSKESFMQENKTISFGKLRASYGLTGNDQISNYLYNALYNAGYSGYSYLGTGILIQYSPGNPDLHWETTKKLDVGLELGFLNDRISLQTDFYQSRSSSQLLYINLPSQTGFTSYTGNLPALIQNTGWELQVSSKNISTKNFTWETTFNLSLNKNKLLSFPNLAASSYSTTYIIGKPVDVHLLYHYTGIDEATGEPTFQDVNKDGEITYDGDRLPVKVGTPYYGGLTNNISYKGFSLGFTFQFNHRYGFLNNTLNDYHTAYYPFGYSYYNQSTAVINRWTPDNTTAPNPKASVDYDQAFSNLASSDFNWGNTSFIKFKNVNLAYELPKSFLSHLKIRTASVYAQGQNLFIWAKQKYTYDPETTQPGTGSGLGTGTYIAFPQLRTFVLGIKLSM